MSKRTIVKTASYTAHAIDMVSIIIFNSETDCTLTLPTAPRQLWPIVMYTTKEQER